MKSFNYIQTPFVTFFGSRWLRVYNSNESSMAAAPKRKPLKTTRHNLTINQTVSKTPSF